jgi:ABC-type amino acid transport substrate-binding protein
MSSIRRTERSRNTAAPLDDHTPSVAAIDALLNGRVAAATSDPDTERWMVTKQRIKRRLAALPDALIERAAVAELAFLQGSV